MMKKMIRRSIVGTALLAVFYATPVYAAQLTVQKSDVITVLKNCSPYFIAIGVILIAAIAFIVYCKKFEKPKKKFLRLQTLLALILALTTVLNLVCLGPVSTLLDVMVQDKAEVSEDSVEEAKDLITNIAEEGTVMVKNNGILPLSKNTKKINVFGWASTNPCYGGTGSGAVDTTNCVTFLDCLEAGGYEVNQTLVNMYTSYAKERPAADMMTVDWTLPEPTTDYYTDEIMKEAKEFSDVAIITIARVGGEGTDLPTDFGAKNEDGSDLYTYTNNSDEYDDFTDGQTYLELSQTEKKMVELVCENFDKVIVIYNSANAMELGWVDEYDAIGAVLCCPGAGETGFAALGSILNGDVNPSGKLADTYVYDLTKAPYFNNFGDFTYDNMDEFAWEEMGQKRDVNFVEYSESKWTGASYALCTTVLRDEWGFNGLLSTDMFCGYGYYDADIAIRSGVDSMLNPMGFEDANVTDTSSATSVTAMRNSCHHILYTVVNSRAYNDENMVYHMVLWKQIMIGVDAGIAILLILLEVLILRWRKKENK